MILETQDRQHLCTTQTSLRWLAAAGFRRSAEGGRGGRERFRSERTLPFFLALHFYSFFYAFEFLEYKNCICDWIAYEAPHLTGLAEYFLTHVENFVLVVSVVFYVLLVLEMMWKVVSIDILERAFHLHLVLTLEMFLRRVLCF